MSSENLTQKNSSFFKKRPMLWGSLGIIVLLALIYALWGVAGKIPEPPKKMSRQELNAARSEYFFNLTRDPETNAIPNNIRQRELNYAHDLALSKAGMRTTSGISYSWMESGIKGIGGRTRALAYDQNNPDIMLAGGVSGGVFKSTDAGETWRYTSDPMTNQSVTALAQDTTGGNEIWYYGGGELYGNSADDRGGVATHNGAGFFKSTDNGDSWAYSSYSTSDGGITWTENASAEDTLLTSDILNYSNPFERIHRIAVNPTNGDVYVASAYYGILKSSDGGGTFTKVYPTNFTHDPWFSDVVITSAGHVIIALTSVGTTGSSLVLGSPAGIFSIY